MKKLQYIVLSLISVLVLTGTANAHVVVKPGDVTTGTFQTFTMGVPNEKGGSVVQVKLDIPKGVTFVTPTVKPGWTIETDKVGEGESAVVKSITWSAGSIGPSLRDEFTFSAKTPDQPSELQWKAYETYDNGVTVAWDKSEEDQPKKADGSPDFSANGPFSVTKVVAELSDTATSSNIKTDESSNSGSDTAARAMGGIALLVSVATFAIATRSKNSQ